MKVTAEGHRGFKGFHLVPVSFSPSVWLQQCVEGWRGILSKSLGYLGTCAGGSPLHPFCVLQQSIHQADDL